LTLAESEAKSIQSQFENDILAFSQMVEKLGIKEESQIKDLILSLKLADIENLTLEV
jgi:hypothetical protein